MKSLLNKTRWRYNPVCAFNNDEIQTIWHDERLSMKAKGLFGYMNTKPSTYDFACKRIANDMRDAVKSVVSAMKELENLGYLNRLKLGNGRLLHDISGNAYVGIEPKVQRSPLDRHDIIMHVEDSLYS
jgi:hypothetical protein